MARTTARVFGIIFIILGIIGFFVPFQGFFSLTVAHDIVHLVSGIVLLAASGSEATAALWCKVVGIIYGLVFIIGLITTNIAGINLMPADDVLHLIIAIVLLVVGFRSARATTAAQV